jgi:hypothetical protein
MDVIQAESPGIRTLADIAFKPHSANLSTLRDVLAVPCDRTGTSSVPAVEITGGLRGGTCELLLSADWRVRIRFELDCLRLNHGNMDCESAGGLRLHGQVQTWIIRISFLRSSERPKKC